MILYVLCIEELLLRFKNNEKIKGYEFYGSMKNNIKVSAYADDTTCFGTNEESIIEIIETFN